MYQSSKLYALNIHDFICEKKKIYPAAVSNMEVIGEIGKNRLKGVAGLQLTEITWRVSET